MKKLMIAAAIVCAAVVSQAAVANWGVGASNIYDGQGASAAKVASGTTVYVFDAAKMAQSALFDAFAANTSMDFTKATGYAATIATTGAGVMAQTQAAAKFSYGNQSVGEDINTYKFFFAIVKDDAIYLSDTITKNANEGDTAASLLYGSQIASPLNSKLTTDGFKAVGQWAAVPEPTSGLLLLLGVAGLALRRRRA